MKKKRKPLVDIVPQQEVEARLSDLEKRILKKIESRVPRLTENDLERLAERIADEMAERSFGNSGEEVRASWKARLKNLIYDLGVGLVTSGIWAAIVYGATQILLADGGGSRSEAQERERLRLKDMRFRIAQGLSSEEWKDLDYMSAALPNSVMDHQELAHRLLASEEYDEFIAATRLEWEERGFVWRENQTYLEASRHTTQVVFELIKAAQDKMTPKT